MTDPGILFAYDFSDRSKKAANRAFQLARQHQHAVHAAHVVDEAFPERKWLGEDQEDQEESIVDRLRHAVADRLKQELGPVAQEYSVPLKPHAAFGYVAEHLHNIGEQTGCRMLVIGAHGRHVVRDFMLGATAEQLLWYLAPPTLVVRNENADPYSRILIAADFSDESEAAMTQVAKWFPEAQVRILHVIDNRAQERLQEAGMASAKLQEEAKLHEKSAGKQLQEMLSRSGLNSEQAEIHILHGHPVEVVAEKAQEFKSDLVVMGGHGRNRLTRWLPGRVASRLVHSLPCDVMLARGN